MERKINLEEFLKFKNYSISLLEKEWWFTWLMNI